MGKKILFGFSLIFLSMGFSLTLDQIFARKNVSSQPSSNKEVVIQSDQLSHGNMKPVQNFTIPVTQALNYNLSRQVHLEKEPWNAFSHDRPVNVSKDGIPCILFWAKRITIKFKNQTWLDVTEEAFSQKATMDASNSKCSEESAKNFLLNPLADCYNTLWEIRENEGSQTHSEKQKWIPGLVSTPNMKCQTTLVSSEQKFPITELSLKFDDAENPEGLDIRFTLTNYNKFSKQSWFSLHRIEIIFNNSIQATFNATGIYAPSSYSYHCQRISSLQLYDALLVPSDVSDASSPWEVTFVDFQIQGFTIKGGQFAKARDCAPSFSPAVLIGLAMSLILLLVLAYALHMLIYLRYLDRHYDFIPSPTHFPQLKARDAAEEKELLRSQGVECYELRTQAICKMYV